jgi:Calcineurin-like phosphoesterase superfamily domain
VAGVKGIGVFSDIHSNRQAFAAIIQVIKQRQELTWLCLGDIVGWFFRPVQCVLMLKELVDTGLVAGVIPGNHDLMALDSFADKPQMIDRMLATAFSAGMVAQCPEAEAFLRSLRDHTIEGETWIAAHHSPFGLPGRGEVLTAGNYGAIEQDLPEHLAQWSRCPKGVVLTGHGHVPCVYGMPPVTDSASLDDVTTSRPEPGEVHTTIPLRPGWRYWVRNGTVGGPYLDGIITSHWSEYRPGECIILHRESYDTRELETDIKSHQHLMTHRETWQKKVLQLLTVQR